MFVVSQTRKFEATGGTNQHINLNPFAIQKNVDVKRLKHQLWDTLQPKLDSLAAQVNKVVALDEKKNSPEDDEQMNLEDEVTMGSLLHDLYHDQAIVNANDVSVQSAFICMLHLANEKGLAFTREEDATEEKGKYPSEANFRIEHANCEKQ